jgi:hypothetical protein
MTERIPIKNIAVVAQGEPTHWYVSVFDEGNSRETSEQLKNQIEQDCQMMNKLIKRLDKTDKLIEEYHELANPKGTNDAHLIACANMNREKRDCEIRLQSELMNIMDDII